MDWLYRFFYTVVSLGILMAALLPLVAVLRFLFRNYEKKFTVLGWWIFFLRSICPVALSSAFCLVPVWNRKYHLLLANMGLSLEKEKGIMRSWRAVFEGKVSVMLTFQICSIIWVIGMAVTFIVMWSYQWTFKKKLRSAKELGENIYESSAIQIPVRIGIFHKKIYLPEGFQAKETAWLLRHMEAHHFNTLKNGLLGVIMIIHWFNPVMWLYFYWWKLDEEMAADERTVQGQKEEVRKEYAQCVLNFCKDMNGVEQKNNNLVNRLRLFSGVIEENTEKRAYRMLYQKRDRTSDKLTAVLVLSLTVIFCFLLTPMKMAWDGGTWGKESAASKGEEIFDTGDKVLVAKMGTTSPEGLQRVIQLEMLSGKESTKEYEGSFVIRMYDSLENEIAFCKIETIFPDIEKGKQKFSKNTTLCINDYNGDDVQELVIGQQITLPEEESSQGGDSQSVAYSYAIISIEDKSLDIICKEITAIGSETELGNSILFERPEKIDDIFIVPENEKSSYYVWNGDKNTYEKKEMTQEALDAHQKDAEQARAGETQEHTLENKEKNTIVLVSTKQDSTGSEAIQSVALYPRQLSKKFEDIKGYYCDLLWVADSGKTDEERYAQLIYNGTKSQTFVVYDTKQKSVYYQHEDGTEQLAAVFKQYREEDITFEENGAVIYSLAEKNGDVLTIHFAADADNGVTVKGSYTYNVVKREASNLTFNRTVDENEN